VRARPRRLTVWDVNGADRATRPDAVLVRAVAGGERDALAVLYAGHAPWLVVRLTRRCNDADLVDEAVQDTFVAVWRSAGRWDGRGEVAAWIRGIGIRRLIDQLRSGPRATVELADRHPTPTASDLDTSRATVAATGGAHPAEKVGQESGTAPRWARVRG
jgi:DNA-directed RNA polymerase specialized sigma24 family protein